MFYRLFRVKSRELLFPRFSFFRVQASWLGVLPAQVTREEMAMTFFYLSSFMHLRTNDKGRGTSEEMLEGLGVALSERVYNDVALADG